MTRVAIVGGGLAGLTVAEALLAGRPDLDVQIFERQARAGGLVGSERVDGFLCETGPNGFLDRAPATLALVDRLGLTPRLLASRDQARRRYVYRAGRLRPLPSSPLDLFASGVLPVIGMMRALAEPLVRTVSAGDETLHAFVARRFGGDAADVLAEAVASGVFGGEARQLSVRSCFPVLAEMEREHGSVLRALVARRRAESGAPRGLGRLTSFPEGVGELVSALTRRLGARLHLATGVERVEWAGGDCRVVLEHGRTVVADAVVVACDAASASRVLDRDRELAAALATIPSAPIVTIALGYAAASVGRPLDGFGFLAPRSSGLRLLGVLWESSVFPDRAPEGHVLLRVMLGGATDPDAASTDDQRLLARVRAELRTTMKLNTPPVFTRIARHRTGLPQFTAGHHDRLARIDRACARHPGLHLGGHALRGVGVNALVEDAQRLAERVTADLLLRQPA